MQILSLFLPILLQLITFAIKKLLRQQGIHYYFSSCVIPFYFQRTVDRIFN